MLINEGPITTFGNLEIGEKFIPYIENEKEIVYEYPSGIYIRFKNDESSSTNYHRNERYIQWSDDKVIAIKL